MKDDPLSSDRRTNEGQMLHAAAAKKAVLRHEVCNFVSLHGKRFDGHVVEYPVGRIPINGEINLGVSGKARVIRAREGSAFASGEVAI